MPHFSIKIRGCPVKNKLSIKICAIFIFKYLKKGYRFICRLIEGSLLLSMLWSFGISLTILWIFFQFIPQTGSVEYTGAMNDHASFSSQSAHLDIKAHSFSLQISDLLSLRKIVCDSKEAKNIQLIRNTRDPGQIFFEFPDNGKNLTKIYYENGSVSWSDSLVLIGGLNIQYIDRIYFEFSDPVTITWEGFTLADTDNNIIDNSNSITVNYIEFRNLHDRPIVFRADLQDDREVSEQGTPITNIESFSMQCFNVSHSSFAADGVLKVFSTNKSEEISIAKRTVQLQNDKSTLQGNLEYDGNQTKIEVHGYANKGDVDGISVYPTFFSWVRDTVLVTPITLITTMFGAITLMHTKKKDQSH